MGSQHEYNVGGAERIIRFGLGFGLLGAAWLGRDISKWKRIGMLAAAAEIIYSAATRHCLLNDVLHRGSCAVPLLGETLAGEVEERYPQMREDAADERGSSGAQAAMGHS